MKVVLYIILGIVILIAGFFLWFFIFFLKVPELKVPQEKHDTEKIKIIDNWLTALQKKNKFNGVVLFVLGGNELLAKGYGFTDSKKDVKLTEHSSLRLASVSKQFTAAGIMLLKERGKIGYDDLVSKYISDFPYQNVTIRNLLNQVSGIPDIYIELAEKNKEHIPLLTNQIAVDLLVAENRKAKAAPNEIYQYSNTNYILLARIIEIVSDTSFEEYMKTELFTPLGMKNTRVWNLQSKEKRFENKAADFDILQEGDSELKPTFIDGVAGDGAVFSSAKDMFIWDKFWYENTLINKANLEEAFKKVVLNNGEESDYGFGWLLTENGMEHNGAWLGANTIIIRDTEKKNCLVVLDNSSNLYFYKIVKALRSAVDQL